VEHRVCGDEHSGRCSEMVFESDRVGRSSSLTVLYSQNRPLQKRGIDGHDAAVLSARQTQVQRVRLAFNERDR
jgi:hypothetical protein